MALPMALGGGEVIWMRHESWSSSSQTRLIDIGFLVVCAIAELYL